MAEASLTNARSRAPGVAFDGWLTRVPSVADAVTVVAAAGLGLGSERNYHCQRNLRRYSGS